jgi:hypothetical protein
MGAYAATAAQLIGPLTVFLSSMLLIFPTKLLVKKLHNFFKKRNLDVPTISSATTLMNLLLMLFSSVSSVFFQLVTCQDIGQEKVVFIDGTKSCSGPAYNFLVFVAAMLSLVPLLLWAGLKFNRIPKHTRAVLCSPYTDAAYYWVALSLLFRFIVSVLSATIRQFPSVSAGAISVCTVCMLMLLLTQRPYVDQRTYYMDIFCHFCLFVQFVLQCLSGASESLGLELNQNSPFFIIVRDASTASTILLCVFLFLFVTAEAVVFTRFSLRYLPYSICAGLHLLELGLLKLIQRTSRFQKLTAWMSDYKKNYRQSTISSAIELSDTADSNNELPASVARSAAKLRAHGVDDEEELQELAQVTDSTAVPENGALQQRLLELEATVHALNQENSRLRGERGVRDRSSNKLPHISAASASDQKDEPLLALSLAANTALMLKQMDHGIDEALQPTAKLLGADQVLVSVPMKTLHGVRKAAEFFEAGVEEPDASSVHRSILAELHKIAQAKAMQREDVERAVRASVRCIGQPQQILIKKGDNTTFMVYNVIGSLSVKMDDESPPSEISKGSLVGTHAYFYKRPRSATVSCIGHCVYYRFELLQRNSGNAAPTTQFYSYETDEDLIELDMTTGANGSDAKKSNQLFIEVAPQFSPSATLAFQKVSVGMKVTGRGTQKTAPDGEALLTVPSQVRHQNRNSSSNSHTDMKQC